MINTNDILARLQKGESVEAIAADFTKTLNEAEKQYNQKSQKREDFKKIIDGFLAFCKKYYPNNALIQEKNKLEDADYDNMLKEIESYLAAGAALMGTIQAIGEKNDDIDSVLRAWANKL